MSGEKEPPKAHLTALQENKSFSVRLGQSFVLGRGKYVSITLDHKLVSRSHAMVELTRQGLKVVDLDSQNGTFLDGIELKPNLPELIWNRATLRLAKYELSVVVTGLELPELDESTHFPQLPTDEYDILGRIGEGAFGKVYAAIRKADKEKVAIKAYRSEIHDPDWRERVLREGKIAQRVSSPHVVHIHDLRVVDEEIYLIMELVNGSSVEELLRRRPLQIPEALRIAEEIALGLDAIHGEEIVHRDVKPGNILLALDGLAKLGDFGIAKDLRMRDGHSLTRAGQGLGSECFVPPEQARDAGTVDQRADIYGLGATLYTMIRRLPPIEPGPDAIAKVLDPKIPALKEVRQDCPEEISDWIATLLSKDPDLRPSSALEASVLLGTLRETHYPDYKPKTTRSASDFDSTYQGESSLPPDAT